MRFIVLMVAVCCLSACNATRVKSGQPAPEQGYEHIKPARLNVHRIEISDVSEKTAVPEGFVYSLRGQTAAYLLQKFEASAFAGEDNGVLLVRIEEVQVDEDYIPTKNAVTGALGVDGSVRYDLTLRLVLEHVDPNGVVLYGKSLTGQQFVSLSEHVSVADRERQQLRGIELLFDAFDPQLNRVTLDEMALRSVD